MSDRSKGAFGSIKSKGWRKRMKKMIRDEIGSSRPWLETVEYLQNKGIPLSLILSEANEYSIKCIKKEARSE